MSDQGKHLDRYTFLQACFRRRILDCCPQWRTSVVAEVAEALWKCHVISKKIRRVTPYLTITHLSRMRDVQHRNITREIVRWLQIHPQSPVKIYEYNDQSHVWNFHITFGKWVDEVRDRLAGPLKESQTIRGWLKAQHIWIRKQRMTVIQAWRRNRRELIGILLGKDKLDSFSHAELTPELKAAESRLDEIRRRLGIVLA